MTWNELSTKIAARVGREFDQPFKSMLVADIQLWRSRLLTDTIRRNPTIPDQFYQTIYTPVETAPLPECLPGGVLCPVYQSSLRIPQPLRTAAGLFDYVGSVDGKTPYRIASGGTGPYLAGGRYSARMRFYRYEDERIKLTHNPRILLVRHVFDDPTKVWSCSVGSGELCDPLDQDIPVTGDVLQKIQEYIFQSMGQPVQNPDNAPEK